MKGALAAAIASAFPLLALSCQFTSGASQNQCQDSIPAACGNIAHCVLDGSQYLEGQFPGSQSFVVRTAGPQVVTFSFTFQNRVSAGTGLSLTSTEPDCSQQSAYTSQGDLFEAAGAGGVLSFPIRMTLPGDHLVQFNSDAYCSYDLRYQ